jgi:hypothetical protein
MVNSFYVLVSKLCIVNYKTELSHLMKVLRTSKVPRKNAIVNEAEYPASSPNIPPMTR